MAEGKKKLTHTQRILRMYYYAEWLKLNVWVEFYPQLDYRAFAPRYTRGLIGELWDYVQDQRLYFGGEEAYGMKYRRDVDLLWRLGFLRHYTMKDAEKVRVRHHFFVPTQMEPDMIPILLTEHEEKLYRLIATIRHHMYESAGCVYGYAYSLVVEQGIPAKQLGVEHLGEEELADCFVFQGPFDLAWYRHTFPLGDRSMFRDFAELEAAGFHILYERGSKHYDFRYHITG